MICACGNHCDLESCESCRLLSMRPYDEQVAAASDSWQGFGNRFGWKLRAFSGLSSARFDADGSSLELTGRQRRSIEGVLSA